MRSLWRLVAGFTQETPTSSDICHECDCILILLWRRHHNIGQYLKNGTYSTPVTPAFQRCRVLSQFTILDPAPHVN